jgi:hypothetical protein
MDQRQPPHSFPRAQDRPLIQNPNHAPAAQQPSPSPSQSQSQSHSTLYHPPSSQQPPVQIPFSDPFQRRAPDPFLPNTHARSGSYNLSSGREAVSGAHGDRPALAGAWATTTGMHIFSSGTHYGPAHCQLPYTRAWSSSRASHGSACRRKSVLFMGMGRRYRWYTCGATAAIWMTVRGHSVFPYLCFCLYHRRTAVFAPVS